MAIITSNISASNESGAVGAIGMTGSLHLRSGSGADGGYLVFDQLTTSGGPAVPGGNNGVLFVSGNDGGVVDIWFKEPGGTSVNLSAEGDITAVRASYGLEGGGTSGDVALGINDEVIPILSASNWFTGDMHLSSSLAVGGAWSGASSGESVAIGNASAPGDGGTFSCAADATFIHTWTWNPRSAW